MFPFCCFFFFNVNYIILHSRERRNSTSNKARNNSRIHQKTHFFFPRYVNEPRRWSDIRLERAGNGYRAGGKAHCDSENSFMCQSYSVLLQNESLSRFRELCIKKSMITRSNYFKYLLHKKKKVTQLRKYNSFSCGCSPASVEGQRRDISFIFFPHKTATLHVVSSAIEHANVCPDSYLTATTKCILCCYDKKTSKKHCLTRG